MVASLVSFRGANGFRVRTERYQGKVRYEGKEVYFVDVAVPEGPREQELLWGWIFTLDFNLLDSPHISF